MSRPVRGAWIETEDDMLLSFWDPESRPVRGAWIETRSIASWATRLSLSRPVRGAWIETLDGYLDVSYVEVAPRAGRVD